VMDNLSAHKSERIRELLESAGCELLYLPPYSPDFSPIEEAFSKIKGLLRKAQARSREALVEAMGKALDAVTTRDARRFFEHCGYRAFGSTVLSVAVISYVCIHRTTSDTTLRVAAPGLRVYPG
jgi:DDE superfamily endonuclease